MDVAQAFAQGPLLELEALEIQGAPGKGRSHGGLAAGLASRPGLGRGVGWGLRQPQLGGGAGAREPARAAARGFLWGGHGSCSAPCLQGTLGSLPRATSPGPLGPRVWVFSVTLCQSGGSPRPVSVSSPSASVGLSPVTVTPALCSSLLDCHLTGCFSAACDIKPAMPLLTQIPPSAHGEPVTPSPAGPHPVHRLLSPLPPPRGTSPIPEHELCPPFTCATASRRTPRLPPRPLVLGAGNPDPIGPHACELNGFEHWPRPATHPAREVTAYTSVWVTRAQHDT